MSQYGSFEYKQNIFWLRKKKMNFSYEHSYLEVCPGIVNMAVLTLFGPILQEQADLGTCCLITPVSFQAFCLKCVAKIIFLISQPKHMLWVLKRTVSMRWFF